MKHIEKDLARYTTSQMPVPNAPVGLAEFHAYVPMRSPLVKEDYIQALMSRENMPTKDKLAELSIDELSLVKSLLQAGNHEAATILANHPSEMRNEYPSNEAVMRLLVRNAAQQSEHDNKSERTPTERYMLSRIRRSMYEEGESYQRLQKELRSLSYKSDRWNCYGR